MRLTDGSSACECVLEEVQQHRPQIPLHSIACMHGEVDDDDEDSRNTLDDHEGILATYLALGTSTRGVNKTLSARQRRGVVRLSFPYTADSYGS